MLGGHGITAVHLQPNSAANQSFLDKTEIALMTPLGRVITLSFTRAAFVGIMMLLLFQPRLGQAAVRGYTGAGPTDLRIGWLGVSLHLKGFTSVFRKSLVKS